MNLPTLPLGPSKSTFCAQRRWDFVRDDGTTRLARHAASGNAKGVRHALQHGADANLPTPDGRAPLHWAARFRGDCQEVLEHMLVRPPNNKAAADVHARTPTVLQNARNLTGGQTPLHNLVLCSEQPDAAIRILVAHGADVNARAANGATPLWTAALWRRSDDAQLAWGEFSQDIDTMRALSPEQVLDESDSRLAAMQTLLDVGANPHTMYRNFTLAEALIGHCPTRTKTLALLFKNGVSANGRINGEPYIAYAAEKFVVALGEGQEELATIHRALIATLLEGGADPYRTDAFGRSPMSRVFRKYPRYAGHLQEIFSAVSSTRRPSAVARPR